MQSTPQPLDVSALSHYVDTAAALVCVVYAALSRYGVDGVDGQTTRAALYVALDYLDSAQDTIAEAS